MSRQATSHPVTPVLFGIPIDPVTMDDALDLIDDFVVTGRRTGRVHQVATVNVDLVVNALEQPDLLDVLQHSDLNLADGMPIVWASGQLGAQAPERVAGADLVPLMARESAGRGWRIHLFGGAPGVADAARDLLCERHPGAQITADSGPVIRDVDAIDDSVFERINAHEPDIVCVAFGNPKQERFIARHRHRLSCPVAVGVGGSLDMLIGRARRAPSWVQRVGGEWFFRAVQEPNRLGPRYARDVRVFFPRIARYWLAVRRAAGRSDLGLRVVDGTLEIRPGGSDPMPPLEIVNRVHFGVGTTSTLSITDHAMLVAVARLARRLDIAVTADRWDADLLRQFRTFGTSPLLEHLGEVPPT